MEDHSKEALRQSIRREVRSLRNALPLEEWLRKSHDIRRRCVELRSFINAKSLLFYVSFGREVETHQMIREALNVGKRVFVPFVQYNTSALLISEVKEFDRDLEKGTFGILEPKKEFLREGSIKEIEFILVPGIAFDREGRRLGFGGGFYDRLLSFANSKTLLVGLAFECQLVPEI
ncbi:MAG: 5-formyltetrahydrofolate cyclo-ligase, partial [Candidatus Tectomicrobia bacterium]|nr:5-formyltetrahydrofolate cyclo-ligase [Candidatus Tectomicrobia bacterium]